MRLTLSIGRLTLIDITVLAIEPLAEVEGEPSPLSAVTEVAPDEYSGYTSPFGFARDPLGYAVPTIPPPPKRNL